MKPLSPRVLELLRLFLLSLGTGLYLLSLKNGGPFSPEARWVFSVFWLETFIFWFLEKRYSFPRLSWIRLFLDLFLVASLIYFSGGRESPFLFLFPLLIFIGSFQLGQRGADLFTLAALILYVLIFWAVPPRPSLSADAVLQFSVPLCAMGLSGLLALRFAEEIRRSRQKIQETHEALFRAEELHRHILHSLASGLIITDLSRKIKSANKMAREILMEEELEGKCLSQILPQLDTSQATKRSELVIQKEGDVQRYIGYSFFPLKDETGKIFGYGFIFQDITEIKEQERRLREAEHLAALGTMASGLVHEIKNPLASICGAIEFLKEENLVLREGERLLEIISREAQRLDKLVTNFLLFARPKAGEAEPVPLRDLLQEITEELLLKHRQRLKVEVSLPEDLFFWGERAKLKQIFLNLFLNALEATSAAPVTVQVFFVSENSQAKIVVRDDAGGIPPEVRERIFEPFFTTKPQGTGLGLAVVYSLVKIWGGRISFESDPSGTTFYLNFPAHRFGKL